MSTAGAAGAHPPADPSDSPIGAAQAAAEAAAANISQIAAQLTTARAQLSRAEGQANIALDRFEGEQLALHDAQQAADAPTAIAVKTRGDVDEARAAVAAYARDSYISGTTSPDIQSLLASSSSAQLIERVALLDAAGDHRSTALHQALVAKNRAAAADGAAKTALATATDLQQRAAAALTTAEQAEAAARQQATTFQAEQRQWQAQLQQSLLTLATLQGQQRAALLYAQEEQASAQQTNAANHTTAGVHSTPSRSGPGTPPAIQVAIHAALRWAGTSYAWGGGTPSGPSQGIGVDASVIGFDCSGLTRYAYAQAGISMPHNSTAQYAALPKVSPADLQPGDLVFYALDISDPATIHHVALYLGDGQMIEAPESGELIHVTPLRWDGLVGAGRPSA